jgi:predicted N-formylglutamate amidohydrolase
MPDTALLVTCEHAVNHVPDPWRSLFADNPTILATHRAWDPGALPLARKIAEAFSAPCFAARISRLLIDHNRSPHNRGLWSDFSRDLPAAQKTVLLRNYYQPFRKKTEDWIAAQIAAGDSVLHLSVHTFTPVLSGRPRMVDIGVLYDTARSAEVTAGRELCRRLRNSLPHLRVRCNQPYRGSSDGHLTSYRHRYSDRLYCGIELEISQALDRGAIDDLAEAVRQALSRSCALKRSSRAH